jgi:hydrogenase maturation factor
MCVALPMKVVAVVDSTARTVRLAPDPRIAADRAPEEVVSAALVADDEATLGRLVGRWGIAHCGFLLECLDEDDAQARLGLFAAMDGAVGAISPEPGDADPRGRPSARTL